LNYIINLLLQLLGLKRKPKNSFGVVYRSDNKAPLDLAIIRLIDTKTERVIQTTVTDKSGRFFLDPPSGEYRISISKKDFSFPSKKLNNLLSDGVYSKLYFGEKIKIVNNNQIINFSVPVDKPKTKLNVGIKQFISSAIEKTSGFALFLGIILALFVFWINPIITNGVTVILYIGLIILRSFIISPIPKPLGSVINSDTGKPLSGIDIKIFDSKYNKLLDTRKTNSYGKFDMLLPDGEYYLGVANYNYNFKKNNTFYQGERIKVNGFNKKLNIKIGLKSLQ